MRSNAVQPLVISVLMLSLLLIMPHSSIAITGEDGSLWFQVNPAGFGTKNNVSIVDLCSFQGNLYAITRNDETGFELWRTAGTGWSRITVPGFTDNNTYFGWIKPGFFADKYDTKFNLNQNIWCDMIEFSGYLYVAVSTGYQGAQMYGSQGFEIWRFDGTTWSPVVSPSVDVDESGTVTALSDCADADGAFSAQLQDSSKSWTANEWVGCMLRVRGEFDGSNGTEAGIPGIRVFEILSNTNDTLTVQQNENAGVNEYTICAEQRIRRQADPGRPDCVIPSIGADDQYTIECGIDERGFGEIWNKSIVDFEILNGELYASIGLNYQNGARIWKTADGVNWTPSSEYSFGLFHGYYPNGDPTGFCLVSGTESRNGEPVSSSVTNLGKSSVTGTTTLFTGGTGTSGCNGRGARVARLDGSSWNLIVDYFVDANETGTNENGLGDPGVSFFNSNFQAWSWAEYDSLLFVSVIRLQFGSRVMYTNSGSSIDGAWEYAVGGGSSVPDGFGEETNIGSYLYAHDTSLYLGTISNLGFNTTPTNGADIWKGTGPGTSLAWTRVTGNGFGDSSITQFEAFTTFEGSLYVAGSNIVSSGFKGEEEPGFSGAKVFKLVSGLPQDRDEDGTPDSLDNCPLIPNGTSVGICTSGYINVLCSSNAHCGAGGTCSMNQDDADGDGVGDLCDNCPADSNHGQQDVDGDGLGDVCDNCPGSNNPFQEDTYPPDGNSCGNACECEANFDGDLDVDGSDVAAFKASFGRSEENRPCTNGDPCNGDFLCDVDVDGTDAALFKQDFGRSTISNPCPNNCITVPWCVYP